MTTPRDGSEPFPAIDEQPGSPASRTSPPSRKNSNVPTHRSSISGRLRRASQSFNESDPPPGFSAATGAIASSIFSRQKAPSKSSGQGAPAATAAAATVAAANGTAGGEKDDGIRAGTTAEAHLTGSHTTGNEPPTAAPYPNGYHFPPSHSFGQSTKLGLKAFWDYFTTPLGFLVTLYGLNVVAWGGMLFLLLCNACESSLICRPLLSESFVCILT